MSELPEQEAKESKSLVKSAERRWLWLVDGAILLVLGGVLFWGTSTQFSNRYNDMTRYQCYAIAFWQGQSHLQAIGLETSATSQCGFLESIAATTGLTTSASLAARLQRYHMPSFLLHFVETQSATQPLHSLPPEYPFLTLAVFSLPLFAPLTLYEIVFALVMMVVVVVVYLVLRNTQSWGTAVAFAFYLALGNWATATDRFDLIPAAFTLGALLLATRGRWKWAFALVALATLYKLYPVLLLIPLLIAQQVQYSGIKWTARKRWEGLAVFLGLCVVVMAVSLLCNIPDTLAPFSYFLKRPPQLESLPAALSWIGGHLGVPFTYTFAYQSMDILSSLSSVISPIMLVLEIVALACTYLLQWRGKVTLYEAGLLTVLIIMLTGKVFSPQYLVWATPLIALVGRTHWKWLLTWGLVCALTTFMFPLHYNTIQEIDQFYPVIVARDFLILGLTCTLLVAYARRKPTAVVLRPVDIQSEVPLARI
jgi:hypothetical protein